MELGFLLLFILFSLKPFYYFKVWLFWYIISSSRFYLLKIMWYSPTVHFHLIKENLNQFFDNVMQHICGIFNLSFLSSEFSVWFWSFILNIKEWMNQSRVFLMFITKLCHFQILLFPWTLWSFIHTFTEKSRLMPHTAAAATFVCFILISMFLCFLRLFCRWTWL